MLQGCWDDSLHDAHAVLPARQQVLSLADLITESLCCAVLCYACCLLTVGSVVIKGGGVRLIGCKQHAAVHVCVCIQEQRMCF